MLVNNQTTPPPKDFLLFEPFITYLQQHGFVIGIDTHLQVKNLVNQLGATYTKEQLKFLIAPIFATNADQQLTFYQLYDTYFQSLTPPVLDTKESNQTASKLFVQSPFQKWQKALLLVIGFLAISLSISYLVYHQNTSGLSSQFSFTKDTIPDSFPQNGQSNIKDVLNLQASSSEEYAQINLPTKETAAKQALQRWLDKNIVWLKWVLLLGLTLAYICYEIYKYYQQKLWLIQSKEPTEKWLPLPTHKNKDVLQKSKPFYQTAKAMRKRKAVISNQLDIETTIISSIKKGGLLNLSYKKNSTSIEYLVLIEQQHTTDHLAQFFQQVVQELAQQDLYLTSYFFKGKPTSCWKDTPNNSLSIKELHQKHEHHTLLIIGDGQQWIDSKTKQLSQDLLPLQWWTNKALFINKSSQHWEGLVQQLEQQLPVLPATFEAINFLMEQGHQQLPTPLPTWLLKTQIAPPPSPLNHPKFMQELQLYLGKQGMDWLRACAIYPEISWPLTLQIGQLLAPQKAKLSSHQLFKICQLDWFKKGHIPTDIRAKLVKQLAPKTTNLVKQHIVDLLQKGSLQLPKQPSLVKIAIQKAQDIKEKMTNVWVKYSKRLQSWKLGLQLPTTLYKSVFGKKLSILSLRTSIRITTALTLISLLGFVLHSTTFEGEWVTGEVNRATNLFYDNEFDKSYQILEEYKDSPYFSANAQYLYGEIHSKGYGRQHIEYTEAAKWYKKAALAGSVEAMARMAYLQDIANIHQQDTNSSNFWYQKTWENLPKANVNQTSIQNTIGDLYMSEKAGERDFSQATTWFKKAAEQGNAYAQTRLGIIHQYGLGTEADTDLANAYYKQAAEANYAPAQLQIGLTYQQGIGKPIDNQVATQWFAKALKNGSDAAQGHLDDLFQQVIREQDKTTLLTWYQQIANQDYAPAQNNLAYIYDKGIGVQEDDVKAFEWYKKAADQGYLMAQNNVGYLYKHGKGTTKDLKAAVKYYQLAAKQGYAPAQNNLGYMLENGLGTEKQEEEAINWYEKAANQDNKEGLFNLAHMHRHGKGTAINKEMAFSLYEEAAELNYTLAQYEVGFMYENGIGSSRNFSRAKDWYTEAWKNGSEKAKEGLERLKKYFTEESN